MAANASFRAAQEKAQRAGEDTFVDDVGRIYCTPHGRATCHVCCMDFAIMNRMTEVDAGLKKKKSRAEELAEEFVTLTEGIRFMDRQQHPGMAENRAFHEKELKRVRKEMAALSAAGPAQAPELHSAVQKAQEKAMQKDVEMQAIYAAWKKENPNKEVMEYGGEDFARLYEQVCAKPPSSAKDMPDKRMCAWCDAASNVKLMACGACKRVYYCSKDCRSNTEDRAGI